MKLYPLIIFTIFLISCSDTEKNSICIPNPCSESNKNLCKPLGESYICGCNPGTHDENGVCVSNNGSLCFPNPCTQQNRTVCVTTDDKVSCQCDREFHLEDGSCVSDFKVVTCISKTEEELPKNSSQIIENITIKFENGVWDSIPECEIVCNSGFFFENSNCINKKAVQCKSLEIVPENSHEIVVDVEIDYSEENGWSEAQYCEWDCNEGYFSNGDSCSNLFREVDCTNQKPENSVWGEENLNGILRQVWSDETETYQPSADSCVWRCDLNYITEDNLSCINRKIVQCLSITPPENGHEIIENVDINYTTNGGWSSPEFCSWECNLNYISEDNLSCINRKTVSCSSITPPENGYQIIEDVDINYTTNGGWSSPEFCSWDCNSGYYKDENSCVMQQECLDSFEPNNSELEAKTLIDANMLENQHTNLTVCDGDVDWFKITSQSSSGLEIDIKYTHIDNQCDIDAKLYKYNGSNLEEIASSSNETGLETLYIQNTQESSEYFIKIYPIYGDCSDSYKITANVFNNCIDDSIGVIASEQDDFLEEAQSFQISELYNRKICDYDDDWYVYYMQAGQKVKIELDFVATDGDLDIFLYNSDESSLAGTYSVSNSHEEIKKEITTSGNHFIKVRGWSGSKNSYSFKTSFYADFLEASITLAIPDRDCITKSIDLSSTIPSNGTITGFTLKNLKVDHTYPYDLTIKGSIGDSSEILFWNRFGGTDDGGYDDDDESDDDIELINRVYTELNDSSVGDRVFKLELCDNLSTDTGTLQNFEFDIFYK
ncbi:PPC domain-containing protein [bacterium]|nr:PPC domain-containing protein [bacterium]